MSAVATIDPKATAAAVRPVFSEFSTYYDLLYSDKNYQQEVDYICALLKEFAADSSHILEFGSGTGRHGRMLAERGLHVVGVERSPEMAGRANLDDGIARPGAFRCVVGDLGTTQINRRFDCVLSLFHVISYQTTDTAVEAAFANAARHLAPGGLFLFDVWHAPAVLSERPSVRVKRVEDGNVHLTRIAEPILLTEQNCVCVDYTLFVEDKRNSRISACEERHLMRYFSFPELQSISGRAGFEILRSEEWLTRKTPGTDTWGVCYVLRKVAG